MWVAGPVVALVMTADDVQRGRQQRHRLEKLNAPPWMTLDNFSFRGRQRMRFIQDGLGHLDFPDVVQKRSELQSLPLGRGQFQMLRDGRRGVRETAE